jgi:polar amino acid transport system permease protein
VSAVASPEERGAYRAAARRRAARRGVVVAAASTLVLVGAVVAVVVASPGWDSVRDTFFDRKAFADAFPDVLAGFRLDVELFVLVEIAVLIFGLVVAVVRTTRVPALFPVRALLVVFTDVFRGIPTILVVYLVAFGVPALQLNGLPSHPLLLGGVGLTLSYTAYVTEVYRAGIDSVHPTRRQAALALGLTGRQALRFVVLLQRCGGCCRRCSTTSSRCRRTLRSSRSSARRRRSASRRSARPRRSTTRHCSPPRCSTCA